MLLAAHDNSILATTESGQYRLYRASGEIDHLGHLHTSIRDIAWDGRAWLLLTMDQKLFRLPLAGGVEPVRGRCSLCLTVFRGEFIGGRLEGGFVRGRDQRWTSELSDRPSAIAVEANETHLAVLLGDGELLIESGLGTAAWQVFDQAYGYDVHMVWDQGLLHIAASPANDSQHLSATHLLRMDPSKGLISRDILQMASPAALTALDQQVYVATDRGLQNLNGTVVSPYPNGYAYVALATTKSDHQIKIFALAPDETLQIHTL